MRAKTIAVSLFVLGALLAPISQASAANAPAWKLSLTAQATNFTPGSLADTASEAPEYLLLATNVGGSPMKGSMELSLTLPPGVTPAAAKEPGGSNGLTCSVAGQTVTCMVSGAVERGISLRMLVPVDVDPLLAEGSTLTSHAVVSGGGAVSTEATTTTTISSADAPFGILSGPAGLSASLTESDGAPATQGGSHPYQLTVDLGIPTRILSGKISGAGGGLRDATTVLPPGLLVDPSASPVLCTEAQLESAGCPDASVVGLAATLTIVGALAPLESPLFNMVPPPGVPAEFAFDPVGFGVYVHLEGGVSSDGDYGLTATASDVLARSLNPPVGVKVQLWGDPSSSLHNAMRGHCLNSGGSCPVTRLPNPLLTLPSACGEAAQIEIRTDSWGEPGHFHEAAAPLADLAGNPAGVDGCNQLEFRPSISSQSTTNLADSPSGLDFDLHQPQSFELSSLSTAALKDATVTLPAGMVANPGQADGLGVCTDEQIGFEPREGEIHFSKAHASCPEAAKLGTLEVTSPLLAQIDQQHKVLRDPEGATIPDPLHGAVYLAKPFDNPFGSLLAIYLVIDDARTGIVAKLAGRVIPDPVTGQLTTRFEGNPQLPLEDVKLHLFGGARGALITPLTCATHATTSDLTPWSSPEGQNANPEDSFEITAAPDGGSCPGAESQAPNKPSFTAGTIVPAAGAYSPFVFKLSREDGSQRLTGIEATLPPGLSGKLAGIAQCSDAQIAAATARSHPNEGILERQSPSCPASSEVGTVDVGAGPGPTPIHVGGDAYLAGPYKGAPLSLAIVTPAVAGPFDLGAVVVRTALYVNPDTAQIHAVSDPLPQILEGIPLDVRSIVLKMARPDFTLNPTSCDPMAVTGSATSSLGQSAALTSPFQVGGCSSLPFKPKLSLKLKGGTKRASHPKLIATLKAKPGEANIAKAQVKLPPSAFLDQAHIRTICTRVQFAANSCPKGSIYGKASAKTPLLDYPLSGNVYLRSSSNKLPDLVVALKGPASQPIEIDLDGKTDSVKGALRNTFEAVPDAPVSSFRLELFGGNRGLVINSRDLCRHAYRAAVAMEGQNGKTYATSPVVRSDCGGKHRKKRHSHRGDAAP